LRTIAIVVARPWRVLSVATRELAVEFVVAVSVEALDTRNVPTLGCPDDDSGTKSATEQYGPTGNANG
jgi:hypothetical protein